MNLPTEVFGDVIVIHAPEELGEDQAEDFEQFVGEIDPQHVVLDLDTSESVASAGLSSLLNCQDKLRERGGDLKVATANACNRKILEITRLDGQLEVYDSVIEAVKSFR